MSDQGTEEWRLQKAGKASASRIWEIAARTKAGRGASYYNYMSDLLCERVTGRPLDRYVTAAMLEGTAREPDARAAYEFERGVEVQQVGFIEHPTIPMSGASPDGLVGDDGMIEIKSPQLSAHIDTLLSETIPDKYVKQMTWQLAVTGRQWVDYVSYNSDLPEHMQLWIKRLHRDDAAIKALEEQVQEFLHELDAKVKALREKYETKELAA